MNGKMIRRDPFDVGMNRFFANVFNDPFFADIVGTRAGAPTVEEGNLALDISEDDQHVIVRASLPGFAKEDIDVEVHDGVLTIKGEHSEEKEERGERYYRKERRFGSVSRRVALPSAVREADAEADLRVGVLTLRFAKIPAPGAKKIKIGG